MRFISVLILSLVFASCSRPFPQQEIKKIIETKLDSNFENHLFTVEKIDRRGSYQYQKIGSQSNSLLMYYHAVIRFNRDYKLSDWEKANIGSLAYIMGANPQGIVGVNVEGNKLGDVLSIHGALNFKNVAGVWGEDAPLFTAKNMATSATPVFSNELERSELSTSAPDYKKSLGILQSIFAGFDSTKDKVLVRSNEAILFDLAQKAMMYQAKQEGYTTMSTGIPLGNYFQLGKAFSTVFGKSTKIKSFSSSGSVENCQLVEEGKADLALIQSDILSMAYQGKGIFSDALPMQNIRAIAALYPEAIMIIVPKSSAINRFKDLKGKHISVGMRGSGNRADAIHLIRAHGMKQNDFGSIDELNYQESFKLFSQGKIDALFITSAFPMPSLIDLSKEVPFRLIPIEKAIQQKLMKSISWIPLKIPAQIFNGVDHSVETMGVTAILAAHKDMPENKVEQILSTLYQKGNDLVKMNSLAGQISRQSAKRGITIPFHPAAKKFMNSVR